MNHSFVHLNYSDSHPGVERMERVIDAASRLRKGFDGSRSLAALLLAAMVSALIVVAEQLIDTWAQGHLMAAWVMLWILVFAGLALLAPTAKSLSGGLMRGLDGWAQRKARSRADERLWALAQKDPRVMADIVAAASRVELDGGGMGLAEVPAIDQAPGAASPATAARVARLSRRIWNE